MLRWMCLGLALLFPSLEMLSVTQQTPTETICPPQQPNSFCILQVDGITSNIAFHPNGQWLAVATGEIIHVRKIADGQDVYTLRGHTQEINLVFFSPDGKWLASNSIKEGIIKLWDMTTGMEFRTINLSPAWVWTWGFSPNGKLLIVASCLQHSLPSTFECDLVLEDSGSGAEVLRISRPHRDGFGVTFVSDELLATGSLDGTMKLWQVPTGHLVWLRATLDVGGITANGKLLVVRSLSFGGAIQIWKMPEGEKLGILHGGFGRVGFHFSPDGRFFVGGAAREVQIWRVGEKIEQWKVARTLQVPVPDIIKYSLSSATFSPNGKLMAIRVASWEKDLPSFVQLWFVGDLQ